MTHVLARKSVAGGDKTGLGHSFIPEFQSSAYRLFVRRGLNEVYFQKSVRAAVVHENSTVRISVCSGEKINPAVIVQVCNSDGNILKNVAQTRCRVSIGKCAVSVVDVNVWRSNSVCHIDIIESVIVEVRDRGAETQAQRIPIHSC